MPKRLELANAIRILSMDAVQKANSGHPGMPMGMADIAEVLWNDFLHHNPANPFWINRDRFILSNGHGSMLLYSILHLTGYNITLDDLKHFRQLHSKTPGHPEYRITPGVETTTGPLGQGLANGVGMAIAEAHMAQVFNRPNFPIIDHYTYVFVGDGCLMEGISHEVCSLAGTLGLGKLIVFYDDNNTSIDGDVTGWFTDNTPERFRSYNWHVIPNINGHDSESIREAIVKAREVSDQPSLICCKTKIGWGAPNLVGSADTHGAPLGDVEVAAARLHLSWEHAPFELSEKIYSGWSAKLTGEMHEFKWKELFAAYSNAHPDLAKELLRRIQYNFPDNWKEHADQLIKACNEKKETVATRKASQQCLTHFAKILPELICGSADLTSSNLTNWPGVKSFSKNTPEGQYIHYGVREFGMSAIMNGLSLYGGLIPAGGTFLTFSDYARNAVRLAAMMKQRVIFIYTHDSIGLGEDGPTHQPIEHISSLRLIPNLAVWRPCDTVETAVAWRIALETLGATCLLFSRQTLPFQSRTEEMISNISRGGYILYDCGTHPDLILIATGSEVNLAMQSALKLNEHNINVNIVSMPSTNTFLLQDNVYKEKVLPPAVTARIAIEAGASEIWYRFVGDKGKIIGIDHFGVSAPSAEAFDYFGFTVENIVATAKQLLTQNKKDYL